MSPDENTNVEDDAQSVAVEETPAESKQEETASPGEAAGKEGEVKKAEFQEVTETPGQAGKAGMDLLLDLTLPVSVELGRKSMTIKEVLSVHEGSVIELERAAGEPVDILVSGKLLGRGEVVVVDDKFGIRITELTKSIEGLTSQ